MINFAKLAEWLLGSTAADQLRAEERDAAADVTVSKVFRAQAERLGPEMRERLAANHFGEGMRMALHQRGWTE